MHLQFARRYLRTMSAAVFALVVSANAAVAQDTVRVKATNAPKWGADVKLAQTMSVGVVDGPDEYAFGSIGQLVVDKRERLYVYDSKYNQIRAYDTAGKFAHNIGRTGGGPGEYQSVWGMALASDSTIVIVDANAARITQYRADGKLLNNFLEPRATWGQNGTFIVDNDGLIYLKVPGPTKRTGEMESETQTLQSMRLLRVRSNGKYADSLFLPKPVTPSPQKGFYLMTADGGNNNFLPESFLGSLRSGGYVFGIGDRLRFTIHPSRGPVRVIEREWKPVAVERAEAANWEEYLEQYRKQQNRKYDKIASVKPPFRDIITDNDSRIWVSMYAPAQKIALPPRPASQTGPRMYWQQPAVYKVFSDQCAYLGRVTLPMRATLMAAQGNKIWVVVRGVDDEEIIHVYTMSGVAAGSH